MCGIVGYTGRKNAAPILLDGLTTLEYRGYDSAGMYLPGKSTYKAVGAVEKLRTKVPKNASGTSGIAHTRWATHGLPTEANAHPHDGGDSMLWLVHNGIIENYKELRDLLRKKGHTFRSETDTEVLAHFIEEKRKELGSTAEALVAALSNVRGTYGIALMHESEPETIYTAALGSPIAIGIGSGEHFVASDASAIVRHTREIVYLRDHEYAIVTPDSYEVRTLDHVPTQREPVLIEFDGEELQKKGYPHFMLKEIMEAPEVLQNSARGRLVPDDGNAVLGGLADHEDALREVTRLIIVGCGSAYYAGLVGKRLIEDLAGIPVSVELGSEFRYGAVPLSSDAALLVISQSGETADTLASIKEAKRHGMLTLGIVNVVGSTIARETHAGIYNHAGPEIGVASTKAFLSQLEVLTLLALYLGRRRSLSREHGISLVRALQDIPGCVQKILDSRDSIKALAEKYADKRDFLYIGRRYNFASAYEGALKLKEVSYAHAEGYGAGEMKHGPIAMIDPKFPTIAIAPRDSVYEKMVSNIEEIRARSGPVLAIATEGDTDIAHLADDVLYIPNIEEALTPILVAVPLQLFAYYLGVARGHDVDRPRNLAKAVTVE
jgi:glucosamine--fructose-6-phosphate aminotransferase (isomerizing)